MSSDPRRDNDQPMFASKTPHFFKIILQEAIGDGMLGIPRKFVRKYGNQLSSPVKLEVPSGAIWQVELTKSDERVWLQKGWREFAEQYSLEFGSFLVFRYQGNDHFHVLIFDRSASEIEYAYTEKARAVQIANAFKSTENPVFMVVMRPSSVSNGYQMAIPLDFAREFLTKNKCNLTLCNSAGKTWPVTYYVNAGNKKRRAQLYGGWQAFVQHNRLGVGDICVFEAIKLHEILLRVNIYPVVGNASKACRSQAHKSKASPVRTSMVSVSDTEPDCQQTRCSPISREFESSNLDKQKKSMNCQYSTKEFGGEFKHYAKHDNGGVSGAWGCLKPDLMDEISMQPLTPTEKQRDVDIASSSSSRLGSRKSKDKSHFPSPIPQKKMRTNSPSQREKNSKLEVLSSGISPDAGINLENLKKVDAEWCVKTEVFSCVQRLTAIEKARSVQIARAFKGSGSGNPVLVMVMRPSFVSDTYRMFVPSDFARKFLAMQRCNLTLCNSSGKTWPAKYYGNSDKYRAANIYGGWRAFVKDNHLRLLKTIKDCKPPAHGSIASQVKTWSLVSDTEPNCQQNQFEDLTDSDIEIWDEFPVNQKTKKKLAPQAEGDYKLEKEEEHGCDIVCV
ncbi:hypothetical protein F3Y22_tig00111366pilonHSYRG00370 [Hibiscus syriacus]|uniref:TF-B3 domain-containing protein n=1 Tax=Hibiscus syriacus TaxID=106335 RepID=A0A6A2YNM4_HIBSY|nr:hypothetical protein F3Y22_tig00111366pilonHSYRG00370 [Hibiscus syriacus]